MEECVFCKVYNDIKEVAYRNSFFYGRFDRFPVTPGHAEIMPIRHVATLFELTDKEWAAMRHSLDDMVDVIQKTNLRNLYEKLSSRPINEIAEQFSQKMLSHPCLGQTPSAYNFGINQGHQAGQTIDHLHIHIIPRYEGDVPDPIGGVRNTIPGMGNYRRLLTD